MIVRSSIVQTGGGIDKDKKYRISRIKHVVHHYEDHGQVTRCKAIFRVYLRLANVCSEICEGKFQPIFQGFVVANIIVAGLLVGLQTYPTLSNSRSLEVANNVVLGVFVIEFILKVISEGDNPMNHFRGKEATWNIFDFVVILLCLPFLSALTGGSFPVVRLITRLFRLARITRLLHEVPTLRVLFNGLISGIKSISYIFMLLLLLFYLYAVCGVFLYRQSDPFYFRTIPVALMTLFRATTLEGWTVCLAITRLGCDVASNTVYYTQGSLDQEDWDRLPSMYKCLHPKQHSVIGIFYWVSFTVVSSLIMLSLFIAVITINMQQTLEVMQKEVEELNKKKLMLKKTKELVDNVVEEDDDDEADEEEEEEQQEGVDVKSSGDEANINNANINIKEQAAAAAAQNKTMSRRRNSMSHSLMKRGRKRDNLVMSIQETRKLKKMQEMKSLLMQVIYFLFPTSCILKVIGVQAWSGTAVADDYHSNLVEHQGFWSALVRRTTLLSAAIVESHYFNNFIIITILFTSVLVGVQVDQNSQQSESVAYLMEIFENFIFSVFALEVVLRMAAEEFNLLEYFSSLWNVFDFLVVAISKVPGAGSRFVVVLRLIRMLRVLKLIKSLPQLSVIVNALLIGLNSITYVGVLMFLMYYVFAIFAVLIFRHNDHFHFSSLHISLFSLFNIATLNNWGDVMYMAVYGCDMYPPLNTCSHPYAFGFWGALYFCVFIIIGSFVLLTLFVGVVTTSMEEATKIQALEREMEDRAIAVCNANHISHKEMGIYRRVFGMLDLDGSGTIEAAELRVGLGCLGIHPTDDELKGWILEVDTNHDGVIDVVEFVTFMIAMKVRRIEAEMSRKNKDDSESSISSDSSSEMLEPIAEEDDNAEAEADVTARAVVELVDAEPAKLKVALVHPNINDIIGLIDMDETPPAKLNLNSEILSTNTQTSHKHNHSFSHLPVGAVDTSDLNDSFYSQDACKSASSCSLASSMNNSPRISTVANGMESGSDKDKSSPRNESPLVKQGHKRHSHSHGHSKEKSHHHHNHHHSSPGHAQHQQGHVHGHHKKPSFANAITEGLAELTDMNFMQREPTKTMVEAASENIESEIGSITHSLARLTHTATDNLAHMFAVAAASAHSSNANSKKRGQSYSSNSLSNRQENDGLSSRNSYVDDIVEDIDTDSGPNGGQYNNSHRNSGSSTFGSFVLTNTNSTGTIAIGSDRDKANKRKQSNDVVYL